MHRRTRKRCRRQGSALLVCTLAAVVLSMASIAILRSTHRSIARIDALQSSVRGRCISQGLYQRSIAILRQDANFEGQVVDPVVGSDSGYSRITRLAPDATRIEVFLYAGATAAAVDTVLDPQTLN